MGRHAYAGDLAPRAQVPISQFIIPYSLLFWAAQNYLDRILTPIIYMEADGTQTGILGGGIRYAVPGAQ
jgi:hypothetical protein